MNEESLCTPGTASSVKIPANLFHMVELGFPPV